MLEWIEALFAIHRNKCVTQRPGPVGFGRRVVGGEVEDQMDRRLIVPIIDLGDEGLGPVRDEFHGEIERVEGYGLQRGDVEIGAAPVGLSWAVRFGIVLGGEMIAREEIVEQLMTKREGVFLRRFFTNSPEVNNFFSGQFNFFSSAKSHLPFMRTPPGR